MESGLVWHHKRAYYAELIRFQLFAFPFVPSTHCFPGFMARRKQQKYKHWIKKKRVYSREMAHGTGARLNVEKLNF